jgi:hypothetical protein
LTASGIADLATERRPRLRFGLRIPPAAAARDVARCVADALCVNGTPAAVAAAVATVQQQIDSKLRDSGLLASETSSTATTAPSTTTPTTTITPDHDDRDDDADRDHDAHRDHNADHDDGHRPTTTTALGTTTTG